MPPHLLRSFIECLVRGTYHLVAVDPIAFKALITGLKDLRAEDASNSNIEKVWHSTIR